MFKATRKRLVTMVGLAVVALLSVVGDAMASPYDFSGVSAPVTAQIGEVLTVALPIAGGLLALFIGWKVVKRLTRG